MAKKYGRLALEPGLQLAEVREIRERAWGNAVRSALAAAQRTDANLPTKPLKQPWKLAIAAKVRCECAVPWAWLARRLQLGAAATLRSYLSSTRAPGQQQTTACPLAVTAL